MFQSTATVYRWRCASRSAREELHERGSDVMSHRAFCFPATSKIVQNAQIPNGCVQLARRFNAGPNISNEISRQCEEAVNKSTNSGLIFP
jgi:hypothetical protein